MKICVIQPKYSFDEGELDKCQRELTALLDKCDDSMDIIVLPEYSDAMADVKGTGGFYSASQKYSDIILEKARQTAVRCAALVFVNAGYRH